MRTIHKFVLSTENKIKMHAGAKFLSLQMQNGQPCAWFEVDTDNEQIEILIEFFGTGHKLTDDAKEYLGTVQIDFGLVFHDVDYNTNVALAVRNVGTQLQTYAGTKEKLPLQINKSPNNRKNKLQKKKKNNLVTLPVKLQNLS